jgi:hypothetical protein
MRKSFWTLAMMMLAFAGFSAAADEPYAGTWKLNVAQSKYQPGPAPQSETVIITPGGESIIKGMDAEGKAYSWSFTPSEGVAVPITGMGPDSTVVEKRPNARTVDHVWKMGKTRTVGHAALSKDGKSFTYTQKGTNENGEPIHDVMLFEKQ